MKVHQSQITKLIVLFEFYLMNPKQSTKQKLPWIHYVIKHNKFQVVNTHKLKQAVTEP